MRTLQFTEVFLDPPPWPQTEADTIVFGERAADYWEMTLVYDWPWSLE